MFTEQIGRLFSDCPGRLIGQGVGYLEDGTMIVVDGGREHINRQVRIGVTSVLQTSAGRMIFGRFEAVANQPAQQPEEVAARA